MLCAEQCTWVVSHLEIAMRRLGVKDQALPIIKHNCRPVTLLLKVKYLELNHSGPLQQ